MPGFNRRGPEGLGPMTGGGRGFCNPINRRFLSRGMSFRTGRGRGFGYNRNFGMGGWAGFADTGYPFSDRDQEENSLRSQAAVLKDELEAVEKRLKELKNTEKNDT